MPDPLLLLAPLFTMPTARMLLFIALLLLLSCISWSMGYARGRIKGGPRQAVLIVRDHNPPATAEPRRRPPRGDRRQPPPPPAPPQRRTSTRRRIY